MRGIPVPDPEEDFAADASELFFDLVFVFAMSRLVAHLVHHPTWEGVGEFTLLLSLIWMPWSQFTWSANAVAGNSRPVRVLFLVAAVASVPMAASVTTAFGDGGLSFGFSAAVILAMALGTMIVGLSDEPVVRASTIRYSIPNWVAIVLMIVGGVLDDGLRVATWIAAIAVILVGTVRAGSDEWLVRAGHFSERHSLIVIVALGETIVALGLPVLTSLEAGDGLSTQTGLAVLAGGVFAGLLWWSYFDRPSPALERHHESLEGGHARGRFARDVYTYLHFPFVGGLLLATAGLEEVTAHPSDPLPSAFRSMLVVGLVLSLLSVTAMVWRAFRVFAVERVGAALVVVVAVGLVLRGVDALVLLVAVDLVLAVMLVIEHRRIEGGPRQHTSAVSSGDEHR
jgi:low temperature requirement protein LtrA